MKKILTKRIFLQFDAKKLGDVGISNGARKSFEQDLESIRSALMRASELFNECVNTYANSMRESVNKKPYCDLKELVQTHQNAKNRATTKVCQ